ncbi:hypothetical protein B9Z55_006887 [Caenorhabditis nigoni]|uniref:Uncharacterized protein n=1 Tax=Caenorhabditis nigoni TaxID=1611254 RepID=A0A2G5V6Y6_9PELO|nr:hypothetical protein B9Z55_006887 [Caenorhabditis nigoni]
MGDLEDVKVSPNLLEDAKDACRKRIMAILEFSKGGPLGGDENCGIHVLDGNQLRQINEWRNPNFPSEDSTSEAPDESASSEQDYEEAAPAELAPAEADQEETAPSPSNIRPETPTSKAPAEPASAEQAPDETTQEEPATAPAYGPNAVLKKEIPEWIKKHEVHEEDLRSHQYIKQIRVAREYEKVVDKDQGKSHSDEGRLLVQGKKEDRNDDKKEEAEMMNEKKVDQEPGTSGTPQRNRKKADRNKNKKKKDQEAGTPGSTQKKKPRTEHALLMAMDFGPKAGGSLGDIRRRMGTERTENAKKVARRSCH